MTPAPYLSDFFLLMFCTLFAPQGQSEFAIDWTHHDRQPLTVIVCKTGRGYDLFSTSTEKPQRQKMCEVVVDKKKPFVFAVAAADKVMETADLTALQKVIKPFSEAPEQVFSAPGGKITVNSKKQTLEIECSTRSKEKFIVRSIAAQSQPATEAAATQPTTTQPAEK